MSRRIFGLALVAVLALLAPARAADKVDEGVSIDTSKGMITIDAKVAPRKINDPRYTEIYPIEVRSTAVSFIYMAGRGVGSFAPVVVPLAAAALGGELAMGMLVVVPTIIIFLAITLSLPETRGRELAAIETDHQGRQAA